MLEKCDSKMCMIGDFNYNDINWETLEATEKMSRDFAESMSNNDLKQKVKFKTRGENILDLVVVQDEDLVKTIEDMGPLGNSDHTMIFTSLNVECVKSDKTIQKIPNYAKANYGKLRQEIRERNWQHDFKFMSANNAWMHFKNTINNLIQVYVPFVTRRSRNSPVWADKMSRLAVKKKERWWKKYRKGKVTLEEYKIREKGARNAVRKAKKKFEEGLVLDKSKNPRKFYSYLNRKSKSNSIGPIVSTNGTLLLDDQSKVNEFNEYFASVFEEFENDKCKSYPVYDPQKHAELNKVQISAEIVEKKIKKLKTHSAPGPDGIHATLLKKCSKEISEPLSEIFQKSMEEGKLPDDFKRTNITPLFKKGDKLLASNYRPINMASIPGKILESIVKDALMTHLEENELLFNSQHGFRAKKSVATCLLAYLDKVTKSVDNGTPWVTFISDFAKAFDKVPFVNMLKKVYDHGVRGKLLQWITDWTKDRKQRVVLNGTESDWLDVISSVVQGSVLGPILFLIYINDLDVKVAEKAPGINLFKFADDSKIGYQVRDWEEEEKFQQGINAIVEWCEENGMSLHPNKCCIMKFGSGNTNKVFTLLGNTLCESACEKDLGVYISNDLKSTEHVKSISSKAHRVLSSLKRSVTYRGKVFIELYKTYVRPIVEASAVVWNPAKESDIKKIEGVQRRALRCVKGFKELSYTERLTKSSMVTLKERRLKYDMVQAYRCLENGDIKLEKVKERHIVNTRSAENENLVKEKCRTNVRQQYFSNRIVNDWNNLPLKIRSAENVHSFKRQLKMFQGF